MARLIFHEHPEQGGACLPGAFGAYLARIPLDGYASLDAVWEAVRARPFEADPGEPGAAELGADLRCRPAQRSRIWPPAMNCWETTAHFVRGALRFLPEGWAVHVWDRTLPNGARHVWPSLVTPQGDHLLVDLQTVSPRAYPSEPYTGVALPGRAANGFWNDVLGGVHVVGKNALKVFGLGSLGEVIEEAEADALPDWARDKKPEPEAPRAKKPEPPKSTPTRKPAPKEPPKRTSTPPPWRDPLDELID